MTIDPTTRLLIDPQLRLKNDVDRAVLITRPRPLADRNELCLYLHPREAVLLALFDGVRTVTEVAEIWQQVANIDAETRDRELGRVLEVFYKPSDPTRSMLLPADHVSPDRRLTYDPMDFIIPASQVNLSERRLRQPYYIYFLPSMFCPQKCVYCYAKTCPRPEEDALSLDRLRELFHEMRGVGVEGLLLSGGDPLARRDIFEILHLARDMGLSLDIPTKTGLSFRRMLELKELGIDLLQVSVDSSVPHVLDAMVGVPGYHRRLFRLLDNLCRAEIKVRVNTVVTPVNLETLPATVRYLSGLGNVTRMSLTPYARSMFCHDDRLFVEEEDLAWLNDQLQKLQREGTSLRTILGKPVPAISENPKERRKQWENRPFCTANREGFVILPDGRVTVCEELYDHPDFIIGDLRQQSVMEVWNSPQALSLLYPDQATIPYGACRTCRSFVTCHAERGKCWRDVIKAYDQDHAFLPDPRCPQAPPSTRLG